MPTPQAYDRLLSEHNDLRRAVFRFLMAVTEESRQSALADLWELAGDYEPSESEQGLIPIPEGYAEP